MGENPPFSRADSQTSPTFGNAGLVNWDRLWMEGVVGGSLALWLWIDAVCEME